MNDTLLVRGFEGGGDLAGDPQGFFEGQRPPRGFALDVLHDQVIRADVVQSADVGVIQRGHGAGFPIEALGEPFLRHLDRNQAVQPRVARLVHFAHAALADQRTESRKGRVCHLLPEA